MNNGWVLTSGVIAAIVVVGVVVMATAFPPSTPENEDELEMQSTHPDPMPPPGTPAEPEQLRAIAALFDDEPFAGGQEPPRFSKAVTPETFVFLQFDTSDPETVSHLHYVGLGLKGRFCAQTQPDAEMGSFPHFHRWIAPIYSAGHGTVPAAEGYWLSWLSVDKTSPGIGYDLFGTPPQSCPEPATLLPGAQNDLEPLQGDDAAGIEALFDDTVFTGGQDPPIATKWINENVFLYLETSDESPWPHVGIGVRGTYCEDDRPTPDFPVFRPYDSATWDNTTAPMENEAGYWMARLGTATDAPGIDRTPAPVPAPSCD